jgi:hypothetical protein
VPGSTKRPVARLWALSWNGDRLSCAIYRSGEGKLEMRLQSGNAIILAEPFDLGPRAVARTNALKRSLERRGWQQVR